MAKRPYFKFYVDDFLGSRRVSKLTVEETGAFLLLLLEASQKDDVALPDNDEELAEICKVSVKKFQKIRKNLQKLFLVDNGLWINERLKKEVSKYDKTVDGSKKAINLRWEKEKHQNDTNVLQTNNERNTNQNQNQNQEKGIKENWHPLNWNNIQLPSGFGEPFKSAWVKWERHISEKGKPNYTSVSRQPAIMELCRKCAMNENRCVQALEWFIAKNMHTIDINYFNDNNPVAASNNLKAPVKLGQ